MHKQSPYKKPLENFFPRGFFTYYQPINYSAPKPVCERTDISAYSLSLSSGFVSRETMTPAKKPNGILTIPGFVNGYNAASPIISGLSIISTTVTIVPVNIDATAPAVLKRFQ